jgi:parallel beta-helix repeat protein
VKRPQLADAPASNTPDTAHLINITGNVLGSQWRAVELQNVSRVTLTGNTIYDSTNLSIFAMQCSGIVVSGNSFGWRGMDSEVPKDGLRFEDCDNVLLSSLTTQRFSAGSPDAGAAVTFVRCTDCGMTDCQIMDPLHRGVELQDSQRCRITNNTIVDRRATPSMRQAIRLTGKSHHNLVAGNILAGATESLLSGLPDLPGSYGNVLLGEK